MVRVSENQLGDVFPVQVRGPEVSMEFTVDVDGGFAEVLLDPEVPGVACIDDLLVKTGRRQGKAAQLLLVAAQEAAARGATSIYGNVTNERILRIAARLVGEENLRFVEECPGGTYELPLRLPQAVASVALADAMWRTFEHAGVEPPAEFEPGISTWVDLTNTTVRERVGLPLL